MKYNSTTLRLIYLWAFVESGLGGLMHLFHVPFTGFVIGGFSIIINILLFSSSNKNSKILLSGLGIVLLIKFTLSPQSPMGAYIAVVFQGLLAIGIFKIMTVNRLSILIYSSLVMFENAIQKPLLLYIIGGAELINEVQNLINNFFHNTEYTQQFIEVFVILYFLIYFVWAVLIWMWAVDFIAKFDNYKLPINFFENSLAIQNLDFKNKKSKFYLFFVLLILVLIFYLFTRHNYFDYIIRTMALFVFIGILLPYIIRIILTKFQIKYSSLLATIISSFPRLKNNCIHSYYFTRDLKGYSRWKEFVFLCIYSNVFYIENES